MPCLLGIAGTAAFGAGNLHSRQKLYIQADAAGAIAHGACLLYTSPEPETKKPDRRDRDKD